MAATRANVEIDEELLTQAMTASGLSAPRATVEEGLRLLIRLKRQASALEALRGIGWEGNLDEMREGWRFEDHDPPRPDDRMTTGAARPDRKA